MRTSLRAAIGAAMLLSVSSMLPSVAAASFDPRPLLLEQRFTPGVAPTASTIAANMLALKGETQGFQLAILTDQASSMRAEVNASSDPMLKANTTILRIGFVNVTVPSTGTSLGAGTYADPLPPQNASANGAVAVTPGQWAGFVVLVKVPADAAAGAHAGSIDVKNQAGQIIGSQAFSVQVTNASTIAQTDPRAFKAIGVVQPTYYRASSGLAVDASGDQYLLQERNLLTFMSDHLLNPNQWGWANPGKNGGYGSRCDHNCWYNTPEPVMRGYEAMPWSARVFPSFTGGFNLFTAADKARRTFIRNAYSFLKQNGFATGAYVWIADEPGQKETAVTLPKKIKDVHQLAPGVKAFATSQPAEANPARKLCTTFGHKRCIQYKADPYSNTNLWDNKGGDDLDAWLLPLHRYYGKFTSPIEKPYHIDHTRDMWKLLQKLRHRGKEVWSYSYLMPTQSIPEMTIDGPPTDARVLMWWNAMEGNQGWLVWNTNRWVDNANAKVVRDPYVDPRDYTLGKLTGNGDTSYFYPPVTSMYGLADPTGMPVSSLRLETLRSGIQDANLVTLYRTRFGAKATAQVFASVFGKVQVVKGTGFTWPTYDNNGMADRLENLRRQMVAALDQP